MNTSQIHKFTNSQIHKFTNFRILFGLALLISSQLTAQNSSPDSCSVNLSSELYKAYQEEAKEIPKFIANRGNGPFYPEIIPIRFTVFNGDNASSSMPDPATLILEYLNDAFAGNQFVFEQCGPVNYIKKEELYNAPEAGRKYGLLA